MVKSDHREAREWVTNGPFSIVDDYGDRMTIMGAFRNVHLAEDVVLTHYGTFLQARTLATVDVVRSTEERFEMSQMFGEVL